MSTPKRNQPFKVFLSYAQADRKQAQKLLDLMVRESNVRVWTDEDLTAGHKWAQDLHRELSSADLMVVLLTPESMASEWVQAELTAAWALEKPILPVVSRKGFVNRLSVPLRHAQEFDLKEFESAKGAERFSAAFREHLAEPQPVRS